MGARFLSTDESPLPENHRQVIVGSDGHDMILAEIPDIAAGQAWPRPMAHGHRRQLDRSPSDRAGAFSLQPVGRCGDLRTALAARTAGHGRSVDRRSREQAKGPGDCIHPLGVLRHGALPGRASMGRRSDPTLPRERYATCGRTHVIVREPDVGIRTSSSMSNA